VHQPRSEGGLELSPKDVQYRLGHSSIGMTMDPYGHLFPKEDAKAEMATGRTQVPADNRVTTCRQIDALHQRRVV